MNRLAENETAVGGPETLLGEAEKNIVQLDVPVHRPQPLVEVGEAAGGLVEPVDRQLLPDALVLAGVRRQVAIDGQLHEDENFVRRPEDVVDGDQVLVAALDQRVNLSRQELPLRRVGHLLQVDHFHRTVLALAIDGLVDDAEGSRRQLPLNAHE
ncbi:hypothetical protein TYRP_001054 [Tyrophagus putrescentiae]|nr:hypothetical protein TYRP_001054 [Tyrophagus putrescentiae]